RAGRDIDNVNLRFHIVSGPAHGTLSVISGQSGTTDVNGTGTNGSHWTASITYTPDADYNGPDSFTYALNDGSLDSNTATVSLTVNPNNDAPGANSLSSSGNEDTNQNLTLAGSDTDNVNLTIHSASGPARC